MTIGIEGIEKRLKDNVEAHRRKRWSAGHRRGRPARIVGTHFRRVSGSGPGSTFEILSRLDRETPDQVLSRGFHSPNRSVGLPHVSRELTRVMARAPSKSVGSSPRKRNAASSPGKAKLKASSPKSPAVEKRLRRFRNHAPTTYLDRLDRACSQRMFVIDRVRTDSDDGPEEVFEMAGTTGNVYRVTIASVPSCDCPDSHKGNQCKHIIYVRSLPRNLHAKCRSSTMSSKLQRTFSISSHSSVPSS